MICKPSLSATLEALTLGQTEWVPFDFCAETSLRNKCSFHGRRLGVKFSVRKDNSARLYKITRTR